MTFKDLSAITSFFVSQVFWSAVGLYLWYTIISKGKEVGGNAASSSDWFDTVDRKGHRSSDKENEESVKGGEWNAVSDVGSCNYRSRFDYWCNWRLRRWKKMPIPVWMAITALLMLKIPKKDLWDWRWLVMNIINDPWRDPWIGGINDNVVTGIALVVLGVLLIMKDDRKVWWGRWW